MDGVMLALAVGPTWADALLIASPVLVAIVILGPYELLKHRRTRRQLLRERRRELLKRLHAR